MKKQFKLRASTSALGFTFVELLVSLIVLSLLLTLAFPSYSAYKARRSVSLMAWEIKRLLEFGRSIAVTQNVQIKICTATAIYQCVREFGERLLVFEDLDKNHRWTVNEPLHRDIDLGDFDIKLSASRRAYIRFKESGESLESGNFLICLSRADDFGRQVIIFRTGRIRLSKDRDQNGYDDRLGYQIVCNKPLTGG